MSALQDNSQSTRNPADAAASGLPAAWSSQSFLAGGSFAPLIREIFEGERASQAGWTLEIGGDAADIWISARNSRAHMPEQGWKLHISAGPLHAEEALRRALPVLFSEDASFKVIATLLMLVDLNSGLHGLSQVGKFITVFPSDDGQAVRLASKLDEATRGLRGPSVPSDHPLPSGGPVSYRYGGFVRHGVDNGLGDLQLGIRNPGGEWVLDRRTDAYSVPEWVHDPFIAGGIAYPLPELSPLLAGRYLRTSTIYRAARGAVYSAVDVVGQRICVVKHARRNGAMGIDGTDACDRQRNEAAVLASLVGDPRFPAVYELFEQDGDVYIAMEELEGETLSSRVRSLALEGRQLPVEQIISWGCEIASMLRAVHSKGYVYRDLKSNNVLVTEDGSLRMLDFDVCQEIGSECALYSPGTIGYMSRQQRAGEAPKIEHDIYGLGALLYFLATGAEPSGYSRPYSLLNRPVRAMNDAVTPELEAIIVRCLEPEPTCRFASMDEVEAALAELGPGAGGVQLPAIPAVQEHDQSGDPNYAHLAQQLGDAICRAARRGGRAEGVFWADPHVPLDHISSRNVSTGSAGTLLVLSELVREFEVPAHREALAQGAHWLATAPPCDGEPLPGLYSGEAGVAAALLRAGQVLGDHSLVVKAAEGGSWVASLPHSMPALFSGTAGRLRAHLFLWGATADEAQLRVAIQAGDALLTSAQRTADSTLHWVIPDGYAGHSGRAYTGYAIGAAGIGDALLDLFEATGKERFLGAAQDASRWIKKLARTALNDGSGLDWPSVDGEELSGAHWGHGAAGIGRFFMHAAALGAVPGAARYADKAARTAANGARWSGPSQGYGLAGNIEFLIDMFRATGERRYLDEAHALGRLLVAHAVEREGMLLWPTEQPTVFTMGYIVGNAGIAECLLRLSAPERLPALLSRENFNRKG